MFLVFIVLVVGALVALDALSLRAGVDSRYESSDPHAPVTWLNV
jgi:hypothetical protein